MKKIREVSFKIDFKVDDDKCQTAGCKRTVDARTAVSAVKRHLQSLQDSLGCQVEDLRLEELELSEDERYWLVTLGFITTAPGKEECFFKDRNYKIFQVDTNTGRVMSMRNRQL